MQDERLRDRHVIITGGAMGIGEGIATRCAKAGAKVTIFDIDGSKAEETRKEIEDAGGNGQSVQIDLSNFEAYDRAIEDAINGFGPIYGLINSAGVQRQVPALETSLEDWDWQMTVDAKAPFFLSNKVAQHMIDEDTSGAIVNIASSAEDLTYPGQAVYRAAKRAVYGFTTVQAKEFGDYGIRVNAINPGGIRTPMHEEVLSRQIEKTGASKSELEEAALDDHISDRFGDPEEIGHMVVLLLSDEGEWITGVSLPVDGGQSV